MKIWVVAGGTGGHFYPGLAVAKECLSHGDEVRFVVRKKDYVTDFLVREKIPFSQISAAGFRRTLHPLNLLAPLKLLLGIFESLSVLKQGRPDVLIVMGGYLSVPPALAAWILNIPVLLHEQNVLPGLANRLISIWARKVAVSFDESRSAFGAKAVVVGNPVRPEFGNRPTQSAALKKFHLSPDKKTILVFGGSLGAHSLNKAVLDVLKNNNTDKPHFQVIHFTGPREEDAVKQVYQELAIAHHVEGYCHDMVAAYCAADGVVCRAGASTVTELIVTQKPAFLVPYPYATGDHQTKNAKVLERVEAAVVVSEGPELEGKLGAFVQDVVGSAPIMADRSKSYQRLTLRPLDAARRVRDTAVSLI